MADVLLEFEELFEGHDGTAYEARVCGRERSDKFWEGWLEYTPSQGGEVVRTSRETTQPTREHLSYWATGLTWAYIDGALRRALTPSRAPRHRQATGAKAYYEGPAE